MRRNLKMIITGLLLMTVGALYGQRGMRGWGDTSYVQKPGREMRMRHFPATKDFSDTLRKGVRPDFRRGYGKMMPFGYGNWDMPFRRVPDRFGPPWFYGPGRMPFQHPFGYGRRDFIRPLPPAARPDKPNIPYLYRIPSLTEKQKKDLESINKNFREEMNKFREENRKKIDAMRKSHLDRIKNILTPEQKKWLEERIPAPSERKKI